jgi:hypothetical protein
LPVIETSSKSKPKLYQVLACQITCLCITQHIHVTSQHSRGGKPAERMAPVNHVVTRRVEKKILGPCRLCRLLRP